MPTAADVEDLQAEAEALGTLAVATLVDYWSSVVTPDPPVSVDGLQEFILDLAANYGAASAATAIDWYESVRPEASPAFTARPVVRDDLVPIGTLKWLSLPLVGDEWEKALERSAAEIQKATFQALVETIGEATKEDPLEARYARFPMNDDPCAYCVLRASRGAIYWSEESASRGDHVKCMCRITVVFSDEPLPYRRAPYMAQYLNGASAAEETIAAIRANDSLTPSERREREFKALLAGMRQANGLR